MPIWGYIITTSLLFAKVRLSGRLSKQLNTASVGRKRYAGVLGSIWNVELTDIICKEISGYAFCFKVSEGRYSVEPKKEKRQSVKRRSREWNTDGALRNTWQLHTANGM